MGAERVSTVKEEDRSSRAQAEKGRKLPTTSEWHWENAVKYAVEGIKTALLLNGAAAIALMTFANTHPLSRWGFAALWVFACGAILSALAFMFAYLTEQAYGNALYPNANYNDLWSKGQRWNIYTMCTALLSVVMFAAGAIMGALALAN